MEDKVQKILKKLADIVWTYELENHLSQAQMLRKMNEHLEKKFPQSQLHKIEKGTVEIRSYCFCLLCDVMEMHSSEIFPILEKDTDVQKNNYLKSKEDAITKKHSSNKKTQSNYQKKCCLKSKKDFVKSLRINIDRIITTKHDAYKERHPVSHRTQELIPWHNGWIAHKMSQELYTLTGKEILVSIDTIRNYRKEGRDMPLIYLLALCRVLHTEVSDLIE